MSKLIVDISQSADGYVAGPGVALDAPFGSAGLRLHRWHGLDGAAPTEGDKAASAAMFDNTGAIVLGRRMFDVGEEPGGADGAFGLPCFVVTSRPRPVLVKGPTTFTFVTDGLLSAIALAHAAAGDRDIVVPGGAAVVQQCLAAGVVDELRVHVVPVLLGGGTPLFGAVPAHRELEPTQVVATHLATHITYRLSR
ncbi:dihydrofolate reductase family protein [Kribbella sp. HUAS MG21]|uniref:Dihydrofolate reductase family protein n=1 Tax=Kribbella sp. HUAS MG21 TaxID=3160966 RepID=A0AAU7TE41_9ACTN